MSKAQTLKSVIKKGPGEKPSFGTDPNDPWSAKANIAEDAVLNTFLKSRGLNPEFASKNQKVSHSKSGEFLKWKKDHMYEAKEAEYGADYQDMVKRVGEKAKQGPMKTVWVADTYGKGGRYKVVPKNDKPVKQGMAEGTAADGSVNYTLGHTPDPKHVYSIHRDGEKEGTYHSVAQAREIMGNMKRTSPNREYKIKRSPRSKMAGPKGQLPEHKEVKENMDAMAACAQPGDGANSPDDVVPTDKNKKLIQMSKSARIIKDIYKRKGMKEEIYDHEKEDKSVATYGKKPKLQEPKENSTKEDPQAAAIMTGGTTLSGQARDTIEIDPMLKMRRPDQNQQKYK